MKKDIDELNKQEEELFDEDDSEQQPPPDVVAYNELRSCADLARMEEEGTLDIQPEFQRGVVWPPAAQTRFIDSLIKQLPIPSMCFSLDYKTQEWQVIDGLQRMTSIIKFLNDKDWKLSYLTDIDSRISGANISEFLKDDSALRVLYKRVQNLSLPVTVLRCDYSKNTHMEYLFTIFHRLNTGGAKLNNQEIRNCIYSGSFNNLLKELNDTKDWKNTARYRDKDYRFRNVELILRFFAFFNNKDKYKGKLARFLNEFMRDNRNPHSRQLESMKDIFNRTSSIIWNKVFQNKKEKVGNSTLEALMFGIAKNISHAETSTKTTLKDNFHRLRAHESLSTSYLSGGVAGKEKVFSRLEAAEEIFK